MNGLEIVLREMTKLAPRLRIRITVIVRENVIIRVVEFIFFFVSTVHQSCLTIGWKWMLSSYTDNFNLNSRNNKNLTARIKTFFSRSDVNFCRFCFTRGAGKIVPRKTVVKTLSWAVWRPLKLNIVLATKNCFSRSISSVYPFSNRRQ